MPGASWTRKDYQAIAEMVGGQIRTVGMDDTEAGWLIAITANYCYNNAKYYMRGNRNFQRDKFNKEAYKQAGIEK
jgi:hypothetical protein